MKKILNFIKKILKKGLNIINKFISTHKTELVLLILILLCIILCLYNYQKPYVIDKDFSKLDLDGYDNIMIVAHPDDELLWGGMHLLKDNYLVVCITCGPNKTRVNEFISVMEATNDRYIMLGYPDKTNGQRDNWDTSRDGITEDLKAILALKDWNIIVTHNPDGEYGHQHHKMTSSLTTAVVEDKSKLYYFGKYHSKKTITNYIDEMAPASDEYYKEKLNLIGLYRSQSFIQTSFDHMFGYEDWVAYADWSSES